jgi:cytochrome P450
MRSRYLWHRLTHWSRIGIPGKRIVDIKWLFTVNHESTLEDVRKYGRVYGTYDFYRDIIVINEPDLIRDILVKDFQYFSDRRHFHLGSTKIGLSLFFIPGNDNWKRIRNIISPSFTSGKLKAMMASMSDISDKFISNLKNIAEKSKTLVENYLHKNKKIYIIPEYFSAMN